MHVGLYIIKGYFGLIQAYSGTCITLTYSQTCHILSSDIFRDRDILKTCEILARNIQNPAIT